MSDEEKAMSDVAKPGTTPASATSRPIIASRTAAVVDPMVSDPKVDKNKIIDKPKESTGSMKSRIEPTKNSEELKVATDSEDSSAEAIADSEEKPVVEDKQVRLGEIIESGEYKVSIKQKNNYVNANKLVTVTFVVILLTAIAVYLLVDLNVIKLGVKLPFDFFK